MRGLWNIRSAALAFLFLLPPPFLRSRISEKQEIIKNKYNKKFWQRPSLHLI
jgi:hypothetical protein